MQQTGDHLQLFLILRATPSGRQPFDLKVLVGIGSQTNLIWTSLVDPNFLGMPMCPLTLMTVSGDLLSGSDKEVIL